MSTAETTPLIFTCIKGEILTGMLLNITKQGYRVRGGRVPYDHIVFTHKVRTGWLTDEQKPYYTECSFTTMAEAKTFANTQLISMETYYQGKLDAIVEAKNSLGLLL
jgi:hypothetical protein